MSRETEPLYRACPKCDEHAARYTPERTPQLTDADRRGILRSLAILCLDPRHIDLDGKARDPANPAKVTFFVGGPCKKRRTNPGRKA